ncbi:MULTISPECIES: hypothetical protein [Sporosarcina]|uniref:Uncharacterized protein n=1 Tax=Sporosarcina contaminans TaxID=633403 RepID=A0ABW3TYH8_9BACL
MKVQKLFILLTFSILVIAGCSRKDTTTLNNSGNSGESTNPNVNMENPTKVDMSLLDYFLPDGSKAHFKGEGNEFAELDIDFAQPYEHYVIVHENNGGALTRYIYKIGEDEVTTISYDVVENEQDFPTLDEINKMKPAGVYLRQPFEVGTTFDKWEIVETGVTVETPYQTFNDAFVIESKEKDAINRKYFAKGVGEVKRESIMKLENGEEYVVTSTLESVSQP